MASLSRPSRLLAGLALVVPAIVGVPVSGKTQTTCVLQYDTRLANESSAWWWDSVQINRDWANKNGFKYFALYSTEPCAGGERSTVWCTIPAAIHLFADKGCDRVIKIDTDAYLQPETQLDGWTGEAPIAFSNNGHWHPNKPCAGFWIADRLSLPFLCRWFAGIGPHDPGYTSLAAHFHTFPAEQEVLWHMLDKNISLIPDGNFFRNDAPVVHHCSVCGHALRRELITARRQELGLADDWRMSTDVEFPDALPGQCRRYFPLQEASVSPHPTDYYLNLNRTDVHKRHHKKKVRLMRL